MTARASEPAVIAPALDPVVMYPYRQRLPAPLYWCYRALRTLATAFCFMGFWSVSVIVGWLWLPLVRAWPGSREAKLRRALRTMRHGFGFFHGTMHLLRLYHCRTTTPVLRPPGATFAGPAVVIANHPTLCDTTAIVSRFGNVVAVTRPTLGNHRLLQYPLAACGFPTVGPRLLQACEERLRMGLDVLIFPEGTRSPRGPHLQPFHRGAFEIAARAKVPVVLVKLTCVPPALSKRLPIWKVADRMAILTIEPFDVIHPADDPRGTKELARVIEQRYRDVLGYAAPVAGEPPTAGGAS